ncbi:MAG: hypothetical protein MZU95_02820 [Desulfomicrobium escambiense]|nr:hypothetical protein [Desulfomicrobium escambiense]
MLEIIEFAGTLGVDTYINEVAEEREEFFNIGSGITPAGESYGGIMETFQDGRKKPHEGDAAAFPHDHGHAAGLLRHRHRVPAHRQTGDPVLRRSR